MTSNEIEQYGAGGGVDGLEDVDDADLSTPILRIVHKEGVFIDNLTSVQYDEIPCVLLGLVKQRVLWPAEDLDAESSKLPVVELHDRASTGHGHADGEGVGVLTGAGR